MPTNTPTRTALELRAISKRYGKRYVLRGVSLDVQAGSVYALVGVNGAGKTTLLRVATGLAYASSGTVRLMGQDPSQTPQVKRPTPHALRQRLSARRQTPHAKRRRPNANAKRHTPDQRPNTRRQRPIARRHTPNARRQTPQFKRPTPRARRPMPIA